MSSANGPQALEAHLAPQWPICGAFQGTLQIIALLEGSRSAPLSVTLPGAFRSRPRHMKKYTDPLLEVKTTQKARVGLVLHTDYMYVP